MKFVCSARMFACLSAVLTLTSLQSMTFAQFEAGCIVESGISAIPPSGMIMGNGMSISPDALLDEADDPGKTINLTVVVHDKAIVTINGEPTFTMGTYRPYIVRNLVNGKKYKFVVEGVFVNETGAVYAATETVVIEAGGSQQAVLHLRRRNRPKPPAVLLVPVAPPPMAAK